MGDMTVGAAVRTVCQIVDEKGEPSKATVTSGIWDTSEGVFSQKTEGNKVRAFTTGKEYFEDFIGACAKVEEEIWIVGWQVNWDAQLACGVRLYDVLYKVAAAGKRVCVLPWRHNNPVQTYDYQTEIVLEEINNRLKREGKKGRVEVRRSASQATENNAYFSHHQKLVVIDRKIAYVGGIDLCYGRYDDATYSLRADGDGRQVMNRYNPCIPWLASLQGTREHPAPVLVDPDYMSGSADRHANNATSGKTNRELEQQKIDRHGWQTPYEKAGLIDIVLNKAAINSDNRDFHTLDPARQPRMPWQDVHLRIEGPAVSHLMRNFVLRWNASGGKLDMPPPPEAYEKKGNVHIQVLRSAPAGMRRAEYLAQRPRPKESPSGPEDHIQKTMLRLIDKASHFIYIENQFFVSAFGNQVPAPNGPLSPAAKFIDSWNGQHQNATVHKLCWFDDRDAKDVLAPPENKVCQALVARIRRAVRDEKRLPFHVYITLPVHPEGSLADASVAVQVYWTMQTIAHGSHSLLNSIRRALKARDMVDAGEVRNLDQAFKLADALPVEELDMDDERWMDYITLLNLRNWEQLGDRYVTEQIYVHSKLMIVDDRYVLLGSANINDRSLKGERDSEIAVLVMDEENFLSDIKGDKCPQPVRKFASKLRKDIWEKLFGITGGVRAASDLQSAIDAPANPKSWQSIQAQANKNAAAYEAAFPFVPRNWFVDSDANRGTAKIIPNWDKARPNPKDSSLKGYPSSPLPFDEKFWAASQHVPNGVSDLNGIKGFITALPVHWLEGENVRFEFPTAMVTKSDLQPPTPLRTEGETQIVQSESANRKENV